MRRNSSARLGAIVLGRDPQLSEAPTSSPHGPLFWNIESTPPDTIMPWPSTDDDTVSVPSDPETRLFGGPSDFGLCLRTQRTFQGVHHMLCLGVVPCGTGRGTSWYNGEHHAVRRSYYIESARICQAHETLRLAIEFLSVGSPKVADK